MIGTSLSGSVDRSGNDGAFPSEASATGEFIGQKAAAHPAVGSPDLLEARRGMAQGPG
jgi:hypothetical protein